MSKPAARDTADILGVEVDRLDLDSAVARVEALIADGGRHQVVVLPVNSIMMARRDPEFRAACRRASLVLPDGVPLLWASRLLGRPIPGRVAGSDLFLKLSETAAAKGYTCFFMGSTPDVLERLSKALRQRCPGLRIAGAFSPPIRPEHTAETNAEIAQRISRARPDILWVAMGAPKQEKWIHDNLNALDAKVVIGVGAVFDMASGRVKRAPHWMQRAGFEWFHRFLKEPTRLFKRYFIEAAPFFPLLLMQGLRQAARRRPRR